MHKLIGSIPRVSDSAGLGRNQESVFLISSQVMLMLLVLGPELRISALDQSSQSWLSLDSPGDIIKLQLPGAPH